MARKTREQRQAARENRRDEKFWNSMDQADEIKELPNLEAIARRAINQQIEYDRARERGETPIRPTDEGRATDYLDMPGGYGYRVFDDGRIEIIATPKGSEKYLNTFPEVGKGPYNAIKAQIEGKAPGATAPKVAKSEAPKPAPEIVMEDETLVARTPEQKLDDQISSLQPARVRETFMAEEGDEFDEEGNLIPSRLKKARAQKLDAQISSLQPARAVQGTVADLGQLTQAAARKALGSAYGGEPG